MQTDQGANISITPDQYLLHDYVLIKPFPIEHASSNAPPLMAIGRGNLEIITTENERIYTLLYHVPNLSGTLLSPDFMCAESNGQYVQFHINGDITTGQGSIDMCNKKNSCQRIVVRRSNGLWYLLNQIEAHKVGTLTVNVLKKLQESELWSMRMGSPGQRQLSILPKHVSGTPSKLKPHKFRIIDKVVDANIIKAPTGHTNREAECFGERLSMDFNFTRASSVKYKKQKGMTRVAK